MARPGLSFGPRFLDSLVLLPKQLHSKVVKCLDLLSKNPGHPGLNVEKLRGKADGFKSARVDQQYRLVFVQPSEEDVRLMYVGSHNDAYEYAEGASRQFSQEVNLANVPVEPEDAGTLFQLSSIRTKKYLPLSKYLMGQPPGSSRLPLDFQQIERIIGDSLPPAARKFPAWWANDRTRHVQASAWLGVGWKTRGVKLAEEHVLFSRSEGRDRSPALGGKD